MHAHPLSEDSRVILLEHSLQLLVRGVPSSDLKLPEYPVFAPVPIVGLRAVVLGHNLDELAREGRVLCLSYPEIRRRFVRVLLLFDILLYVWNVIIWDAVNGYNRY